MHGFARYTISGQFAAFTVVFGFSILAFIMPLSAVISAAAVVLITLYATPRNGALITLSSIIAVSVITFLLFKNASIGAYTSILQLLPSLVLGSVLFTTRSLAFSIQIAALLGVLGFIAVSILIPNIQQYWIEALNNVLDKTLPTHNLNQEQQAQLITMSAQFMTGVFIALVALIHSTTLLIGNWWHNLVTETDTQNKEFHELRLGKVLAFTAIILAVVAAVTQSAFVTQILGIVAILFLLQGLAILHATLTTMNRGSFWLVVMYGILIFLPQACFLVIFAGLIDTFIDIRQRVLTNNT